MLQRALASTLPSVLVPVRWPIAQNCEAQGLQAPQQAQQQAAGPSIETGWDLGAVRTRRSIDQLRVDTCPRFNRASGERPPALFRVAALAAEPCYQTLWSVHRCRILPAK